MTKPEPLSDAYFRKVKFKDGIAKWTITIGGIGIIAVVIGMLILIAFEAIPLFKKATYRAAATVEAQLGEGAVIDAGIDEYFETGFTVQESGDITFFHIMEEADRGVPGQDRDETKLHEMDWADTNAHVERPATPEGAETLVSVEWLDFQTYLYTWDNGVVQRVKVEFTPVFREGEKRVIEHDVRVKETWAAPENADQIAKTRISSSDDSAMRVDVLKDGRIQATRKTVEVNFMDEETVSLKTHTFKPDVEGLPRFVLTGAGGQDLYLLYGTNTLLRYELRSVDEPKLMDNIEISDGEEVSSLGLVLGDISLAVGLADGSLSTWMPIRPSADAKQKVMRKIHPLGSMDSPILAIRASQRDKTLYLASKNGQLGADNMTAEKTLFRIPGPPDMQAFGMSARGDGLIAIGADNSAQVFRLKLYHPSASVKSLFGKVHYENYDEPTYVWQSTGGTTEYEPKLSQVNLIFGTMKATFYAMIFAAPLAILGAIYTSQFLKIEYRNIIKPAVEIMAAVPSVVVGFMAGLWLSPMIERQMPTVFFTIVIIPVFVILSLIVYARIYHLPGLRQLSQGYEFLGMAPMVILAVLAAMGVGNLAQRVFFDGNFNQWYFETTGNSVDPRNSVVIAFALGFAVIPIIFTIADDALSAVPKHLSAASLALGASRWQTAWRVVLPSASPGIFAALMIGLGRAVGETMIILMATGNTPIMDFNIFKGMRTLSANIATEMPEAPVGGTLFRSLYLSAVILFVLTFFLNTLAEVIRIRLRKKYGNY